MIGIYKIENTKNNKVYIGQSRNIERRWSEHLGYLQKGTHHCKKLQEDFRKFGISSFSFSIIVLCGVEELDFLEKSYINYYSLRTKIYNYGINSKELEENKILIPNNINLLRCNSILAQKIFIYLVNDINIYEKNNYTLSVVSLSKKLNVSAQLIYRDIDKSIEDINTIFINKYKFIDTIGYDNGIINISINKEAIKELKFNSYVSLSLIDLQLLNKSYFIKLLSLFNENKLEITIDDIIKKVIGKNLKSYETYANIKLKIINPFLETLNYFKIKYTFSEIKLSRKVDKIIIELQ